jgi:type IV pilus assembly protein PilA
VAAYAAVALLVLTIIVLGGAVVLRHYLRPKTFISPEAKSNLKGLFTSQKSFQQEKDRYETDARLIGFIPELGNAYTYFTAPQGRVLLAEERRSAQRGKEDPNPRPVHIISADPASKRYKRGYWDFAETGCPLTPAILPDGTRAGLGITTLASDPTYSVFIGAAVGDIDPDPTPDCWSIATVSRMAADGTRIEAGEPYNELNDVLE